MHLIGIGVETSEKNFQEINVELAKRAVEICKQSKIKKIIYFSGLGVSKDSKSNYFTQWLDGFEPDRYYKILIKVKYDDKQEQIFDDNFEFKVKR